MKTIFTTLFLCLAAQCATAQLTNGLVGKYSFNGGNANDEAGTNNGVVTGATLTEDRFGNANMAYSFDGVDDHITLGDVAAFEFGSGDFSASLWVYYTASQEAAILSKRAGLSANFNMYAISILADPQSGGSSQNIWSFTRSSTSADRAVNAGVQSGAWHHIVYIHDYSDSSSIYVDGVFVGSNSNAVTGTYDITGHPLVLGYSEEANAYFYTGLIDDVALYNRVLTAQDIDDLYNAADPMITSVRTETTANLRIYPNPSENLIYFDNASFVSLNIYAADGRLHSQHQTNANYLEIGHLSAGLYLLELVGRDGSRQTAKFRKL